MDFLLRHVFRMGLLDRYVLRSFVETFLICFTAFLGILLIFDLNDNLTDFLSSKVKWTLIGTYYLHQLPHFVLLSMPIGVLLAMLYCLSKMSRANEIISMLTAGRSVVRVLLPLFGCGIVASAICLWLNYDAAPRAAALQKQDMERITKGDKKADSMLITESLLAKDRLTNRIWFIREVRKRSGKAATAQIGDREIRAVFEGPTVIQQEGDNAVITSDPYKVTVEKDRVLLDTEVLAKISAKAKKLDVTMAGGQLTVTADGVVKGKKTFGAGSDPVLVDVNITQLDDKTGAPTHRWQSQRAVYTASQKKWQLHLGRRLDYDESGQIVGDIEDWSQEPPDSARALRSINIWRETPYRLMSTTFNPDQMSVPQLREYVEGNADFSPTELAKYYTNLHHRWALPLSCLAVVLISAPLGIIYSRRAVLASVAASIFIFFIYIFLNFLMLALGKGAYVPPWVAAWSPDIALGVVGLYLLWLRSTNRELPSLFS